MAAIASMVKWDTTGVVEDQQPHGPGGGTVQAREVPTAQWSAQQRREAFPHSRDRIDTFASQSDCTEPQPERAPIAWIEAGEP